MQSPGRGGMALLKGLQLAWNRGFRKVIIESNSNILIDLLNGNSVGAEHTLVMFQVQYMNMIQYQWELQFAHISKEQNRVADCLAKNGISVCVSFHECPAFFRTLVSDDHFPNFYLFNLKA